ncbi:MAG: hypothetical protein ACREU8_07365 [Gammaproteobacteria bacterium]
MAMAVTTVWVIWQEKRHHKDSFMPICVLVPEGGIDPFSRSERLKVREPPSNDPGHGLFAIHCALKNVGAGPALNVTLEIRCMGIKGYGVTRELSPLAKDEARGCKDDPILIPVVFREDFNRTDFAMAQGPLWEIFLEYQDVFGRVFHTRHTKKPQEPWAAFGNGPASKGRTSGDCPDAERIIGRQI